MIILVSLVVLISLVGLEANRRVGKLDQKCESYRYRLGDDALRVLARRRERVFYISHMCWCNVASGLAMLFCLFTMNYQAALLAGMAIGILSLSITAFSACRRPIVKSLRMEAKRTHNYDVSDALRKEERRLERILYSVHLYALLPACVLLYSFVFHISK